MAVPTYIEAANAISDPSLQTRIAALKHLKSAVIGHSDKKEELVRHGILEALVKVLQDSAKSRRKRKGTDLNGQSTLHPWHSTWTDEDEACLQAVILLSSLAHAGPAFVTPIIFSFAVPQLVECLSPLDNHRSIVTASLKALNVLASSSLRAGYPQATLSGPGSDPLYTSDGVRSLALILAQRPDHPADVRHVDIQVSLVARLVRKTVPLESHCNSLLCGGVLDLLSARLASAYIHRYSSDTWDSAMYNSVSPIFARPSEQTLPHLLAAINTVVGESKYRGLRLIGSPLSRNIFTLSPPDSNHYHSIITAPAEQHHLPRVTDRSTRLDDSAHSRNFPTLSTAQMKASRDMLPEPLTDMTEDEAESGDYQSSLTVWLFATIKDDRGMARSQAALLSIRLYLSRLFNQRDEHLFSSLVIPYLLETLDEPVHSRNPEDAAELNSVPLDVLSQLIDHRPTLQRFANDAGAVKKVCSALSKTFEPITVDPSPWSPSRIRDSQAPFVITRNLASSGMSEVMYWLFQRRRNALLMLAAIASSEEKQRQACLSANITQNILDSMKPLEHNALRTLGMTGGSQERQTLTTINIGNPESVLIAACIAAKCLSRSVGLLRTSLSDAGLAKPTLTLLHHIDPEVRKAATDVIINLTPEFSPMRKEIVETGFLKTLSEQVHSADPKMRLASLWALKHLAYQTPNSVKTMCFDELGAGWLVQIITGSTTVTEQPIYNLPEDDRHDRMTNLSAPLLGHDAPQPQDDFGSTAISLTTLTNDSSPDVPPTTTVMRALFESIQAKERRDHKISLLSTELNVQRQGLDFIRNIMMGPQGADMIDLVLHQIGTQELFDLISHKLKAHASTSMPAPSFPNIPSWGTSTPTTSGTATPSKQSQPSSIRYVSNKILHAAIIILSHIAGGNQRQQQLLISQSETILAPLLHLLDDELPEIRVATLWCINNLTWREDNRDEEGVRSRAVELRRHGFVQKLDEMVDDPSVDVRERVSTGREQLRRALDPHGVSSLEMPGDLGLGAGSRRQGGR